MTEDLTTVFLITMLQTVFTISSDIKLNAKIDSDYFPFVCVRPRLHTAVGKIIRTGKWAVLVLKWVNLSRRPFSRSCPHNLTEHQQQHSYLGHREVVIIEIA